MVLPLLSRSLFVIGAFAFTCAPQGESSEPAGGTTSAGSGGATALVEPDAGEPVAARKAGDAPERFEQQGTLLGLFPSECVLVGESNGASVQHHFEFPGECHFATNEDGSVRVVETDTGAALIVESSRPVEQDCDTALRVVVITKDGPRLSRGEQHVAMCAPGGWDEMMFHVLASDPVVFGTAAE